MPDRIPVRATRNGGLDYIEVPTRDEALVASLLLERRGYVIRNLPERVAQVDVELRRLGASPPVPDQATATPARRRSRRT